MVPDDSQVAVKRRSPTGSRWLGGLFLLLALITLVIFGGGTHTGPNARFVLNPALGGAAIPVPDLVIPARPAILILGAVIAVVGVWELVRGVGQRGLGLTVVAFCFVMAFLVWATWGKMFNMTGMLSSSLVRATPIALAAMCGVLCERSGIINIAVEGMMLVSALTAVMVATMTDSLWAGMVAAIATGMLLSALHAVVSIQFKVNQTISGVAINILGAGLTSFISARFLEVHIDRYNNSGVFPPLPIPVLSRIPVLGPTLFQNNIVVYLMLALMVVIHVGLFMTPWGLRVRAVGEHPRAADTLGINVYRTRYISTILGGIPAGIAGAYFTIGSVGRFNSLMTAGKGFIGLAAMIFGNWTPVGSLLASLLFGFADSLQVKLQILRVPIGSEFLLMAPYLVTIIVLTGVVGRAHAPAAEGIPYEKE